MAPSSVLNFSKNSSQILFKLMLFLFTNPSARAGYDAKLICKRSTTGLNSEFSFSKTSCLTKAEEPSLPYYLPIVGGRMIGFIPFPRVLAPCEMRSVSSRIWTRVAVSISYDDNHYTTGTSTFKLMLLILRWLQLLSQIDQTFNSAASISRKFLREPVDSDRDFKIVCCTTSLTMICNDRN